jgi:hypothetical protein
MGISLSAIVTLIILAILLKFATRIALKVLGFVLIVGLVVGFMYYNSMGPFKGGEADILELREQYCGNTPKADADICDCIVRLAEADLEMRFTKSELDSLRQDKLKSIYILEKSLKATKVEAIACLTARNSEDKYKAFLQDFIPIENEYLDKIQEGAQGIKEKLQEEYDSFINEKEELDEKY